MKTKTDALTGGSAAFLAQTSKFMPRVMFAPEDGTGSGDDKTSEEEAAEKTTSDKAAADKTAADAVAAADKSKMQEDSEKQALLREVMDKKSKLQALTGEVDTLKSQLKAFDGIDVEKFRALVQKETDAEKAAAEAKGDFERVKAMIVEEHSKEKKTLSEQLAELQKQLQTKDSIIDGLTVGNDFASSTFIQKETTLSPAKARKLYGDHFEVKDGRTVAFDKPVGAKDRTELTGADGKPLAFDAAFKRIIESDPDKDSLLRATVNAGAGSKTVAEKASEKAKPSGKFGIDRIRGSLAELVEGSAS
ncbi:MAG: hypothetical protein DI537_13815 [Stutzerimonas stutzeri]|nr:MAG: hypothetical protein DI537_13815 [Stutzerimonas stutzeri]